MRGNEKAKKINEMKKQNVMKRVWQVMKGLAFVLALECLTGCPQPEMLEILPASLDFSHSGGEISFTIDSNTSWTVSSDTTSWLTVSPSSGSNNGTITVTAMANSAKSKHTATFSNLRLGTFSYTASCSGRSWSGSVTLGSSCQNVRLQ